MNWEEADGRQVCSLPIHAVFYKWVVEELDLITFMVRKRRITAPRAKQFATILAQVASFSDQDGSKLIDFAACLKYAEETLFLPSIQEVYNFKAYLLDVNKLKASTARHRIQAIMCLHKGLYDSSTGKLRETDYRVQQAVTLDLENLMREMKALEAAYTKSNRSYDSLRVTGHIPEGEMSALRTAYDRLGEYFANICQIAAMGGEVSQAQYDFCLKMIFASFWLFSPNARVQALNKLSLVGLKQIIATGQYESRLTKTYASCGPQSIIVHTAIGKNMLAVYHDYLRSQALERGGLLKSKFAILTYSGKALGDSVVSHWVPTFWREYAGWNTTITDMRVMIETATKIAAAKGILDQGAPAAMLMGQGHSVGTSNRDYFKLDNFSTAHINASSFDLATRSPAKPSASWIGGEKSALEEQPLAEPRWYSLLPSPIVRAARRKETAVANNGLDSHLDDLGDDNFFLDEQALARPKKQRKEIEAEGYLHGYNDWGSKHPQGDKPSKLRCRILWSDKEAEVYELLLSTLGVSTRPHIDALEIIKRNPEYRAAFHPHHVKDSTRLREAENAVKRRKEKTAADDDSM
jgi:hypothetical protein